MKIRFGIIEDLPEGNAKIIGYLASSCPTNPQEDAVRLAQPAKSS